MKIIKIVILTFCLTLFNAWDIFAQATDPPEPWIPPEPPGSPIDQDLFVLVLLALFFGIYIIYKNNYTKKASV